jgi:hypothetical protein
MLVIVNGAFGVGKTTVVRIVRERLRGSTVFDPERIGYVLQRLPRFIPVSARELDDYQDSAFWRFMTAYWAGHQARCRRVVLLPMCFSNFAYLEEIRSRVQSRGCVVHHVCLTASPTTILSRLAARGLDANSEEGRWVYPRALKACALHLQPQFAVQIPTDDHTANEVADEICLHATRVVKAAEQHNDGRLRRDYVRLGGRTPATA